MTREWQCKRCGSAERYEYGRCKRCHRAQSAAWAAANTEKVAAMGRAHYAANKKTYAEKRTAWNAANPDRHRSHGAKWRAANLGKARAISLGGANRKQTAQSLSRLFSFLDEMQQESST